MHGDVGEQLPTGHEARSTGAGAYVPALDGLRAVAVIAVLAFHAELRGATGGYLGVSLFFTLSGFLMGGLLLREREHTGRVDLGRFWERRFRRLLPAAIVTLAAVAVLSRHLDAAPAQNGVRTDILAALGYVANWRFLLEGQSYASLFEAPSPVQHFWSLAIEEQFYVVFPLLLAGLFLLGRGRRVVVAVALMALCVASVASQLLASGYDRAYYGTDTRACELLAGALLACAVVGREHRITRRRRIVARVGVAAFAGFVALVALTPAHASWVVHGGFGAIALVNVALIRGALVPSGALVAVLSSGPLVAVGRVSYGLYLYHWPVFLWLDEERTGMRGVTLLVVRIAVTAAVAVLSYHLLEYPIRHRRFLVRRPHFIGVLSAGLAVAVALAATAPQPAPVTALFDERAFTPTPDPSAHAVAVAHQQPVLRVMVVGDSTGHAVAQGLAGVDDMEVLDATRPGCPLLRASTLRTSLADAPRDVTACASAPARWPVQAARFQPDLVLVVGSFEDASVLLDDRPTALEPAKLVAWYQTLVEQYTGVVDALRATGAVVAWADLPLYTLAHRPEVRAQELADLRVNLLNVVVADTTTRTLGAVTLDYASHFNTPDGSVDLRVRPDGIHAAPLYVHAAARTWLGRAVRQSYAAGRLELGLPTDKAGASEGPAPLRVLVVGDSTSLNLATGLANHARAHGDLVVDWAGQVACPMIDVARYRLGSPDPQSAEACEPAATHWAERAARFHPDVVVVFSLFMDAMELDLPDIGWSHLGQRAFDAEYASQQDEVIRALAPSGAVVIWSDAPRQVSAAGTRDSALDGRFRALNALIAQADTNWRHVVTLPLAAHVDAAGADYDRSARPDGIHFTLESATAMADTWLVGELVARQQQALAEASTCRAVNGTQATIDISACRTVP